MVMRRVLGSVLPALLLASLLGACSDDEAGTVTEDPAPTASSTPTKGSTGEAVPFELVKMITETGAAGRVDSFGAPLGDDVAVQQFISQFKTEAMATQVQEAVQSTQVPNDKLLYGAVVALGCDAPTDVEVISTGSGLQITAVKVPSPQIECFAAMTTVALVLVTASAIS